MNKANTIYTAMYSYIEMLNSLNYIGYSSIEYYGLSTLGCVILESRDPYTARPGRLMFIRAAGTFFDRLFTTYTSSRLQLCTYSYQLHRLEKLYAAFLHTLPLR